MADAAPPAWTLASLFGNLRCDISRRAADDWNKVRFRVTRSLDLAAEVTAHDLRLCVRLACLAYTDDVPGTVNMYDTPVLRGTMRAVQTIAGGPEHAKLPLSSILQQRLGFTAHHVFSCDDAGLETQASVVDTQGFIAHCENGDVALVFRGTTNAADWMTNLDNWMVTWLPHLWHEPDQGLHVSGAQGAQSSSMCCTVDESADVPKVHRGFHAALHAAVPDIKRVLLPQLEGSEPKRLILAGHSLGGAIALLALSYILSAFDFAASPHKILLVTLGAPRAGNAAFAAHVEAQVAKLHLLGKCSFARLVHSRDVVPTLPPQALGFAHTGACILFDETGMLHTTDSGSSPQDQADTPALSATRSSPREVVQSVLDHAPIRYLDLVEKVVPDECGDGDECADLGPTLSQAQAFA